MTGAREESDPKWAAWNGTCGRAGGGMTGTAAPEFASLFSY